ncbi:asparagine synthase (glutamine-hydrolyzing) [bacterium F11]|nr:asparagine synthase (glutamine-hydrolyzing) [bacterium F11]
MCGIAGYFGTRSLSPSQIEQCLGLMKRRGPDHSDFGQWKTKAGKNVYLLHSRLSIIDLDPRSHQPSKIGPNWMVFNGELYNYLEIRKELEAKGHSFSTSSDTEVLLRAIDVNGWEVLDKLEGMWAFAIYNEAKETLSFSRDRFGEKPLYIYRDKTGLYFGSEVKFIQSLLGKPLEFNLDHISRYLVNGYKSLYKEDHKFYRNLRELHPATYAIFNEKGEEINKKYWIPQYNPKDGMTFEQAVEGTREKLIDSVKLRLRSDVPLAFCMSGGVDSNSLISIAKRVFDYDVHGFTIVNTDPRYDEREMVEHSVSELKIRHTTIPVNTKDFLPKMRTLVRQHDAPVITITYFTQWLLIESIAKHGYKISISGSAADEFFTGYFDHHLAYLYEVRKDKALHQSSRAAWMENIKPIVRNPFLRNPDLFIEDAKFRDHIYLDARDFSKYLKRDWFQPFSETSYTDDLLRNRMMNELFHEAIPVILHEDDLNSMFYSIENRSPFLDRRLFDFCSQIPSRLLIRDGRAKAVLREAMRGIVPDKVLDSPRKVGFNSPIYSFLDVNDRTIREQLLDKSPIFDLVNRESIEKLMQKPDLPNSESKFLFYFLSSKLFLEECRI